MSIRGKKQTENEAIDVRAARKRLLAKRSELLKQLRPGEASQEQASDEDQARILHDQFVMARVERLAFEQLKMVNAALARLDAGEYGICVDCEEKIQPKRLLAIPWACRCLQCQEHAAMGTDSDEYGRRAA